MRKKVKLGIWVDAVLVEEFRRFVAEQYGKIGHGLLGFEVSQAQSQIFCTVSRSSWYGIPVICKFVLI